MIRLGTFVWLALLTLIGVGLYQVELGVLAKETELRQINRQIDANREAVHVLDAEWSYLNDPTRLADLTRRYTDLIPITPTQIATLDQLPLRPRDPPPFDLGLPDGTMPHPEELAPDASAPAPLLSSAQPAPALDKNALTQVISATASAPVDSGLDDASAPASARKPAKPVDEQAAADDVIDAILSDMRKAQQK